MSVRKRDVFAFVFYRNAQRVRSETLTNYRTNVYCRFPFSEWLFGNKPSGVYRRLIDAGAHARFSSGEIRRARIADGVTPFLLFEERTVLKFRAKNLQ